MKNNLVFECIYLYVCSRPIYGFNICLIINVCNMRCSYYLYMDALVRNSFFAKCISCNALKMYIHAIFCHRNGCLYWFMHGLYIQTSWDAYLVRPKYCIYSEYMLSINYIEVTMCVTNRISIQALLREFLDQAKLSTGRRQFIHD